MPISGLFKSSGVRPALQIESRPEDKRHKKPTPSASGHPKPSFRSLGDLFREAGKKLTSGQAGASHKAERGKSPSRHGPHSSSRDADAHSAKANVRPKKKRSTPASADPRPAPVDSVPRASRHLAVGSEYSDIRPARDRSKGLNRLGANPKGPVVSQPSNLKKYSTSGNSPQLIQMSGSLPDVTQQEGTLLEMYRKKFETAPPHGGEEPTPISTPIPREEPQTRTTCWDICKFIFCASDDDMYGSGYFDGSDQRNGLELLLGTPEEQEKALRDVRNVIGYGHLNDGALSAAKPLDLRRDPGKMVSYFYEVDAVFEGDGGGGGNGGLPDSDDDDYVDWTSPGQHAVADYDDDSDDGGWVGKFLS